MKRYMIVCLAGLLAHPALCLGQASGNVGFAQNGGRSRAEQRERVKRTLSKDEMPPTNTSMFVEANVLMNVRADEYVAVFGLSQEGETAAACNQKLDLTIAQFAAEIKALGIPDADVFVDFIAQNKIYGYEISGDNAKEKLVGFDLKKNVAIHYKDKAILDKLIAAAARCGIFDLIKVDYIVTDPGPIQDRLMEEATRITKRKAGRYEKLLDIKLQPPAQVYAERSATHFPTALYDSYTAAESEQIGVPPHRERMTIQSARKSRTFFFNGLDADGFDIVINPVVIEPVVQFTLYLKLKYEVAPVKAK